jgi:hypothetical protein
VVFEPAAKAYDYPTSLDTEFRRKVRTLAGVYQMVGFYPRLLGPANRMWIHFVSHKLGRLLLPQALLLLAAATFGLPDFWRNLALAGQLAFYSMAAFDILVPERWMLKRISSPVRTFVVLMAAAFCAMSILFCPSRVFWKEATASS